MKSTAEFIREMETTPEAAKHKAYQWSVDNESELFIRFRGVLKVHSILNGTDREWKGNKA